MTIGFIGLGNMASAILEAMLASGKFSPESLCGYDPFPAASEAARKKGVRICAGAEEAAQADAVILAVKPHILTDVLPAAAKNGTGGRLFISIAAGKTIAYLKGFLGEETAVARVMPNINARVGAATSAYTAPGVSAEQKKLIEDIFSAAGTVTEIPESLFSIFMAVASASPAFTYMYIDALAKAAVRGGIPRAQALAIAASSVLGSAKMVLEDGAHPIELADQVCSPGGTTIQGVCALQANGFEHAVHAAVEAAAARDAALG